MRRQRSSGRKRDASRTRPLDRLHTDHAYGPRLARGLRFEPDGTCDALPDPLGEPKCRPVTGDEALPLADALRHREPWQERSGKHGSAMAGNQSARRVGGDGYVRQRWRYCLSTKPHSRRRCDMPYLKAEPLEAAVIRYVMDRHLTEEALGIYLEALLAQTEKARPHLEEHRAECERQLAGVNLRIQHLLDAIETSGGQAAVERLRQRQAEARALQSEISSIGAQLAGEPPGRLPDVAALRRELEGYLNHGPMEEAKRLLS